MALALVQTDEAAVWEARAPASRASRYPWRVDLMLLALPMVAWWLLATVATMPEPSRDQWRSP
jgi:hypothetical protein